MSAIAVFGGIYSNYLALEAALADARRPRRRCDLLPRRPRRLRAASRPRLSAAARARRAVHPGQLRQLDRQRAWPTASAATPIRATTTSPASATTTPSRNTSPANRAWMRDLPLQRRLRLGRYRVLMCHGSPRQMNEFLWESTTSDALPRTSGEAARRRRDPGDAHRHQVASAAWRATGTSSTSASSAGRRTTADANVWYALLEARPDLRVEFVPVEYDHERLAREMAAERLPEEFVETVLTGWWTTCLEVLPAKERRRGRF